MKFLDGLKTIIGLAGSIVTIVAPKVAPDIVGQVGEHVIGISQGVFGLLTVLGLIHKAEKANQRGAATLRGGLVLWLVLAGAGALAWILGSLAGTAQAATVGRLTSMPIGAGDSVRFVARFDVPTTTPPLDSITVRWELSTEASAKLRRFVPPFGATVTDTALFSAPPTPGGGTAGGEVRVTTWRGALSTTVIRGYQVTLAALAPPPGVSGLVFLDSAVVVNP